jgi:hypothetical protein
VGVGNDDATVRFEPCGTFMAGADPTVAACSACGWFEEDHWFAEPERARPEPPRRPREVALTARS